MTREEKKKFRKMERERRRYERERRIMRGECSNAAALAVSIMALLAAFREEIMRLFSLLFQ